MTTLLSDQDDVYQSNAETPTET